MPAPSDLGRKVETVRRFNRFYTGKIGVLRERLLKSPFSLTEARVLYELAHRKKPTATEIAGDLGLDAGYLSRILRFFGGRGLIEREASQTDGRRSLLALTRKGREAFGVLDTGARDEVRAMLRGLNTGDQSRLVEAMGVIQGLLGGKPGAKSPYLLRPHQPGDMGWVVHRHGTLYAQEYGWDDQFEALVASIVAKFIQSYDPKRERCWIAESDGEIVGSVFIVSRSKSVAQLRLLLVEPKARGLGIGARLVSECVRFARQVGYRKMTLWTNANLHAARHIYEKAGFHLVHEEKHHSFGQDLTGQNWELML